MSAHARSLVQVTEYGLPRCAPATPIPGLLGGPPHTCERCGTPFHGGSAARRCPSCRYIGRKWAPNKLKYRWTPERDAVLRERYDGRVPKRASEIARDLGWPKWVITHRAAILGLARPKVANWSAQEVDFLLEHTGTRSVHWMAKRLNRTVTAVVVKLKQLHLSRRIDHGGYGLLDLAEAFGCDHHSVDSWIRKGWLSGTRVHAHGAHPEWVFTQDKIREFIRDHPMAFRLDKVDQLWFMDLVFEGEIGSEA